MARDLTGLLSRPFEGGGGPSHSTIDLVFELAGAGEYVPSEGNKLARVIAGLRALRDGREATGDSRGLPADPALFRAVVDELGARLVEDKLIPRRELEKALEAVDVPAVPKVKGSAPGTARVRKVGSSGKAGDEPDTVFVVHGHDPRGWRHQVARLIERATPLKAIILHEQANAGRSILEKFEEHAQRAAFAVALFTGDDSGAPAGGEERPRARQNVVFELGFFFGLLGRARTAILIEDGVERPSDIHGLVYIPLDDKDAWHLPLLKEFQTAGIPTNLAR